MKQISPAPEETAETAGWKLVDKVIERAVETLLQKADEAARNGEL